MFYTYIENMKQSSSESLSIAKIARR